MFHVSTWKRSLKNPKYKIKNILYMLVVLWVIEYLFLGTIVWFAAEHKKQIKRVKTSTTAVFIQ